MPIFWGIILGEVFVELLFEAAYSPEYLHLSLLYIFFIIQVTLKLPLILAANIKLWV
jgi:hypothetical protein